MACQSCPELADKGVPLPDGAGKRLENAAARSSGSPAGSVGQGAAQGIAVMSAVVFPLLLTGTASRGCSLGWVSRRGWDVWADLWASRLARCVSAAGAGCGAEKARFPSGDQIWISVPVNAAVVRSMSAIPESMRSPGGGNASGFLIRQPLSHGTSPGPLYPYLSPGSLTPHLPLNKRVWGWMGSASRVLCGAWSGLVADPQQMAGEWCGLFGRASRPGAGYGDLLGEDL
jgi:hypothetical protein